MAHQCRRERETGGCTPQTTPQADMPPQEPNTASATLLLPWAVIHLGA